jgi:2-polyprenyl-3-methyl-5-hydroxy-6-metoxy-1,4-benzoquinol methylase
MWISEQILFQLALSLYQTEVAHSLEMKNALQHINACFAYRTAQINRIIDAAECYRIQVTGRTIVDFGCNDGAISAEYLRRGAVRVIGVDIDERAIQRARALHNDERISFVHNAVNTVPLEDRSVDTVISYDVFEHVSQPAMILKELYRILKPASQVLIGSWSWWHPFASHLWSVMPVPWAHLFFSEKTILRVCRRIYLSTWYTPNMHDYDQDGQRLADKYTHESISTDYLNKYLIQDFERAFQSSGFVCETHLVPFGSRYARWTRVCLHVPWLRELLAGYVWFVLTKSTSQTAK